MSAILNLVEHNRRDDTWRAPVAKYFKGEIVVAKDLMVV